MKNYQSNRNLYYNNLIKTLNKVDKTHNFDNNHDDNNNCYTEFSPKVLEKCNKCNHKEYRYICPKCKIKYTKIFT